MNMVVRSFLHWPKLRAFHCSASSQAMTSAKPTPISRPAYPPIGWAAALDAPHHHHYRRILLAWPITVEALPGRLCGVVADFGRQAPEPFGGSDDKLGRHGYLVLLDFHSEHNRFLFVDRGNVLGGDQVGTDKLSLKRVVLVLPSAFRTRKSERNQHH